MSRVRCEPALIGSTSVSLVFQRTYGSRSCHSALDDDRSRKSVPCEAGSASNIV